MLVKAKGTDIQTLPVFNNAFQMFIEHGEPALQGNEENTVNESTLLITCSNNFFKELN
jgi:hypothetical protein